MRRRTDRAPHDLAPPTVRPSRPSTLAARLLALQRRAGNRAVGTLVATPTPGQVTTAQRKAGAYDPGERAAAVTGRGILPRDVTMLAATGSAYNAAANSVVVADFAPGSAAVRDSARRELRTWAGILERSTRPFAILGFTDPVGEATANQTLRAARARAVAALLPGTARRASVIGPAPAGDFLVPANSTPAERALNRAVLLRLPPEELRQAEQVDEFSLATVRHWRANPNGTVQELIDVATRQAATLLDRNGVPQPDVTTGSAVTTTTLAYFEAATWTITIDPSRLAAASQTGVTPATRLSDLAIDAVAELASGCYHEYRHAEQSFLAARLTAQESGGRMSPRELATRVGIPFAVADAAVSASATVMPDVLATRARAWGAFQKGGRHLPYKQWNDRTLGTLRLIVDGIEWDRLGRDPGSLRTIWERVLHPFLDRNLRRDLSFKADALLRSMQANPRRDELDEQVLKALTATAGKLFIALAREGRGRDLTAPADLARMSPAEADLARINAKVWLLELQIALIEARDAAEDAYRAYANEADAYEVGEAVKESVKRHGS